MGRNGSLMSYFASADNAGVVSEVVVTLEPRESVVIFPEG